MNSPCHSRASRGIRVLLALFLLAGPSLGSERPNVLFLSIDDLRPELGCYGVEEIHTPHIDRLAERGVPFLNAHCQLAVCNPSRVSLLTGLRPDSTRVWTLDVRFRETIPDAVTLPQHFKNNGYRTIGFGKIFHNPWPDNVSWSEPHQWPKGSKLWSEEARQELRDFQADLREKGVAEPKITRLRARATEVVNYPDHEHIDGAIARQALIAMRDLAKREEPFFLAAGFIRPHLPFVVPKKYWDLYDRDSIPLAENAHLPRDAPPFVMNSMYELRDYFDYLETPNPLSGSLTESQQRELKHGYYASVSLIDAQVGLLLDELEALDLSDNTIVVLWSDHGWKLGEHNSWCKQTNYEIDTRVPLIICDPRAKGNGTPSSAIVELLDLFPTLCDLTGLEIPNQLEGTSLRPILDDPGSEGKDAAISQFLRRVGGRQWMGYAMRTSDWRYIEWIDRTNGKTAARELYDHRSDSSERENVSSAPEHADRLQQLGKQLRSLLPRPIPITQLAENRPSLVFENQTNSEVTVFWLPEMGEPRRSGTIAPGGSHTIRTTIGHRFRVVGEGVNSEVTARKQQEKISIRRTAEPAASLAGKPNILVIMGDDWSWPHASILGDPTVRTPHFDRIAREGVLFERAFTVAPSCTPSRHAVASGQEHWRLGEGVDLGGSIGKDVIVYPDQLSAAGYESGFTRKGTGPSQHTYRGNDPFGPRFENFESFLSARRSEHPFCFWYGAGEPHRPYRWKESLESDLDLDSIRVPPFLPDNETTRIDLGDYYRRVEKLDSLAGELLNRLEKRGELENTIVIMTSDNGMPFPRAKATLYDSGTRVPLAIRWGKKVKGGRRLSDFVTLTDLAPTLLEAAGLPIPDSMTGKSLLSLLTGTKASTEPSRAHVITGMERHVYPNPSRAIRTDDFLYIRNFSPESWPSGRGPGKPLRFDFAAPPWPTVPGAFSSNVDPSPTKQWMRLHAESGEHASRYQAAFGRRPAEELYDLQEDPDQQVNLLAVSEVDQPTSATRDRLSETLTRELRSGGDPRFQKKNHSTFDVVGWTVHLHDQLWRDEPRATRRALEILAGQLNRVVDVVPGEPLRELRKIPIWINPPYEGVRGTAEYHPERGWLEENGREPDMVRSVEITNTKILPFENRRMPYLLLHELAHGYHDRALEDGYENEEVRKAFERARDSGSYDEVARFDGNRMVTDRAYALSNPMEYFAESTEAFFGKNDFFPFTPEELKSHDPDMFQLLLEIWHSN